MIQKEKTALGSLTPEQLAILVGTKSVRERLNCQQGGEIEIIRGRVDSNIGLTLFDLIMGESDVVDVATFRNISNLLSVPFRFQRNFVKTIVEQQLIISAIFKKQLLGLIDLLCICSQNSNHDQ